MTLRLLELYTSYQGEGPNTGKPTIFVRFAGCNLKCPGWPCDTQHAIDPALFKDEQEIVPASELANRILNTSPIIHNVCLTGGEPFLQNRASMTMLLNHLKELRYNVEVFTNGQIEWPSYAVDLIDTFIMDWKLPGSREFGKNDNVQLINFKRMSEKDAVKFTIADVDDFLVAKSLWFDNIRNRLPHEKPMVYAGVVWDGELTTEELCSYMQEHKLPWYLNVQVHKFIWPSDARGV
jgi:7-carboxy-7-deazaguanine synthase